MIFKLSSKDFTIEFHTNTGEAHHWLVSKERVQIKIHQALRLLEQFILREYDKHEPRKY